MKMYRKLFLSLVSIGILFSGSIEAKKSTVDLPENKTVKCYCNKEENCRPGGGGAFCDSYLAGSMEDCADKDPMCVPPPSN